MSDLISRCELFNRLATIPAPAEANEFKAEIYEVIQSMETADVAYICDREKCERCDPRCDLTRDKEHAATTEKVVLLDGISRPQGEWLAVSSYDAFGGSEELWNAHGNPTAFHYCSKCKAQSYVNEFGEELLTDYCPNCGAQMKGADDE